MTRVDPGACLRRLADILVKLPAHREGLPGKDGSSFVVRQAHHDRSRCLLTMTNQVTYTNLPVLSRFDKLTTLSQPKGLSKDAPPVNIVRDPSRRRIPPGRRVRNGTDRVNKEMS
jgi:hypothetical protein